MPSSKLRTDALDIWQAGVEAVKPARLIADKVRLAGTTVTLGDIELDLSQTRRLVIVGAGKASSGLAIEFERQICRPLLQLRPDLEVRGWINCPEGSFDSKDPPRHIRLFSARPAGMNEPTERAVEGTSRILEMVGDCQPQDVVVCLLSGGGSALLTAPAKGLGLEDKQNVARLLSGAGANIEQLNCVRRALSRVKGGGLARACTAGHLVTLAISDVLGDSLQTIASGPTCIDAGVSPADALDVISDLGLTNESRLARVVAWLGQSQLSQHAPPQCEVQHSILGNNADAVDAAGVRAVELGYRYAMECARQSEPDVLQVADRAVAASLQLMGQPEINCWISGGEPTVMLPTSQPAGKGGRNQQLALAVLKGLKERGWPSAPSAEFVFISGGTDGEDGPTDAAGALIDKSVLNRATQEQLDLSQFLAAANAYPFFERTGGLVQTGGTGTNVCDLRVALVGR